MPRAFISYTFPNGDPERYEIVQNIASNTCAAVASALSIRGTNPISPEKVVVFTHEIGRYDRQTPNVIVEVNTEENEAREDDDDHIRDRIAEQLSRFLPDVYTLVVTIWFRKGTKGHYKGTRPTTLAT